MDLDAYSAAHDEEWQKLARLASTRSLSGLQADELIDSYQSGASQLSAIQTTAGSSVEADVLSLRLSRARLRFTGTSANVLQRMTVFFALQLPAALYRVRILSLVIAGATFLVAFLYGWWATANPQVLTSQASEAELQKYTRDFVNYYSNFSGTSFTSVVWTNNAWLAALTIATGITGVFPAYLLLNNAQNLGLSAAVMNHFGLLDTFFLYISPHGQLELYSLFVSGAAGFAIFWAWIAPGQRTRAQALAQEGRALFTITVGLMLSLLVSGLIEGNVTRQPWPWPVKIGMGTVALAAFLFYQWFVGRRAVRAGETGDLEEFEAGATQLVSA